MGKLLIEINEETLSKLDKDEYIVFAEMTGVSPQMKMLYAERGQAISDLGKLNKRIAKLWEDREF